MSPAPDLTVFCVPPLVCEFLNAPCFEKIPFSTVVEESSYNPLYSVRPNIRGYSNIAGYYDLATASGGALSACSRWTFSIAREPGTAGGIINIDASGSNPIYGASTTNQPASVRSLCLIRAYQ